MPVPLHLLGRDGGWHDHLQYPPPTPQHFAEGSSYRIGPHTWISDSVEEEEPEVEGSKGSIALPSPLTWSLGNV